jgi:hypothetical protein
LGRLKETIRCKAGVLRVGRGERNLSEGRRNTEEGQQEVSRSKGTSQGNDEKEYQ